MYQILYFNNEYTQTILMIAKLFLILTQNISPLGLIYFIVFKFISKPFHSCEVTQQLVGQIYHLK